MAARKKKPTARSARAVAARTTRKPAGRSAASRKKTATKKPAAKKKAPAKKATATKKKAATKKATARTPASSRPSAKAPAGQTLFRVLRDDGSVDRARDGGLSAEKRVWLYETMVRVREFDRRMLVLQRQGRIGFYGPILGQEAATIGSVAALEDRDWIYPALREGAAPIMRGLPLHVAIAQLIGNEIDRCKGRQMPCHYTYKEGHYYGMSSVIGTQITHAVGAAMAAKIRGDDVVVAGYLGDGATSANDFHAGMNFAAVYDAPVVLICQNNQWAISVPASAQSASETIAIKATAYGMPSMRVDGNDVLAVHAATRTAVERARGGGGPTFIELVTYRRLGHSSSDDPSKYRDESEVKTWEGRDPVERFRRHLENQKLWDDDRETALQDAIAREVNDAITRAEDAGPPAPETLITDVFAEVPQQLRDQFDELESIERDS